jgi:hypothetical protein
MRIVISLATALVLVLPGHAAQAPPITAPVFDGLLGRWEGRGTILGQEARVAAEWTAVLERRFFRLSWTSAIGTAPARAFEGHAYYRIETPERMSATWYDSTGQIRPIDASVQAGSLVARWGTPETEVGETTYHVDAAGRLEVIDRVRGRNGEWREFGRSVLTRTGAAGR